MPATVGLSSSENKCQWTLPYNIKKKPESLWQLSANFRARMTVHPEDGASYTLTVKAPRGLYTDLSSVPQELWALVGPIGRHLEASILHDYLCAK